MHRSSLNHTYRLVWSDVENAFVAVAENVKGRGKSSRSGPALGAVALFAAGAILAAASGQLGAQTLPTGGNVVAGSASIATSGSTLTVTQTSARMAADWQSFNIGQGNTVNFVQPTAASVALNRVLGADVSVIQGALNANGQVFLINPNGVLFTPTAQVNVGGIVASTLNLSAADFMAGNYQFEGSSANAIVNQGRITAMGDGRAGGKGGTVALIAAKITNTGTLTANQGNVLVGAGAKVTLDLGGPVKIQVTQGAIDALIEQGGAIRADGGLVYLTAKAAGSLASSVINHTGVIEASSLSAKGGTVMLEGDSLTLADGSEIQASGATGGGTVLIGGDWQGSGSLRQATTVTMASGASVDASVTQNGDGGKVVLWSDIHKATSVTSAQGQILAKGGAQGGSGGQIETSGYKLVVNGIKASTEASMGQVGNWLLDPYSITIGGSISGTAYSPPDFTSAATSTILASDISAALTSNNVTIQTGGTASDGFGNGDITVASSIDKTGATNTTLTLKAHNDIIVNAGVNITATTGALNVTLNSDSDANSLGGIRFASHTSNYGISSNGGNIVMGGGADPAITAAFGDRGVDLDAKATINAGAGNVSIRGTSNRSSADTGIGVRLYGGASITGANVTVIGAGSANTGSLNRNWGVSLESSSAITASGTTVITGTGGAGSGSSANGNNNHGIFLDTSSSITASGSGNLTLTGTGGGTGTSTPNFGIYLYDSTVKTIGSGAVALIGTGGMGTGGQFGIKVGGSLSVVAADGSGTVAITGTGGTGASGSGTSHGVSIESSALVRSAAGNVSVTGTGGGNGGGSFNYGVIVQTGATVQSGGSGTLSISGTGSAATGSDQYGAALSNGTIKSAGGAISVTGAGGSNGSGSSNFGIKTDTSSTIGDNSSGAITLQATGGSGSNDLSVTGSTFGGTTYSRDIAINANTFSYSASTLQTTGALTIAPRTSFGSAFTWSGSNAGSLTGLTINSLSSLGGLTIGKSINTADITVGGATSIAGPISLYGGNINLNANLTSTLSGAAILAKASASIVQATSVAVATNAGDVTYWADSDASGKGAIRLQDNASVASTGGNVFFGGGTTLSNGFAAAADDGTYGNGVELSDGATVAAGVGSVTLRGSASVDRYSYSDGVRINGAGSAVSGGNITVVGQGSTAGASDTRGVAIGNGASVTGSGTVNITGTGGAIAGIGNHGVAIGGGGSPDPANISATGTGTVTIVGTGGGTGASTSNDGINILTSPNGSAIIRTESGALQLTGTAGVGNNSQGIDSTGVTLGQASQSGNTTLNTNSLLLTGSNSVLGSGTFTLQSLSASAAFDSAISTSNLSLASTLTGLTIGKTTNTADITVANAASIAGPITIYGGNINLNANLTSTLSGAAILAKASGSITQAAGVAVATSNGAVTYQADSDATGGGRILMGNGSASSASNSISSNGGNITLSGGLDVTTGYAKGYTADNTTYSGNGIVLSGTTLSSGGGNIVIRGEGADSNAGNNGVDGVWLRTGTTVDSGTGTISVNGRAPSTTGVRNGFITEQSQIVRLVSASTNANAISIIGDATTTTPAGADACCAFGVFLWNGSLIAATGAGGGVTINGQGGTVSGGLQGGGGVQLEANSYVLASSGAITLTGTKGTGSLYEGVVAAGTLGFASTLGGAFSGSPTSPVTASTSNISINTDSFSTTRVFSTAAGVIQSTGTLTVAPISASFTSALSASSWTLGSGLSGLTLGKAGNTADITVGSAASIDGPISIYGGNINLNANLSSTLSSAAILLNATGDIVISTGRTLSTNSGNITFSSDKDGDGIGGITMTSTTINTTGGNITMGGGTAGDGTGYTGGLSTASYNAGGSPASRVGIGIGNSTLNAAGGNIALRGRGYYDGGAPVTRAKGIELVGNTGANVSISTTGAGTITLDGQGAADTGGINYGVNFNNSTGSGTISVSAQDGAINITGTGGNGGNNNNVGVKLEGGGASSNVISSTGGSITITGTAGAAGSGTSGLDIGSNSTVGGASTTGAITLAADTAVLAGSYRSSGALTVKPTSTVTTIGIAGGSGTLALSAANFSANFVNGFSGITVGRSDGTGAIATGAFTSNDNLTLLNTTGGIAIGGTLNAVANTLTLNTTGTATQTAGITAGSLALLGTGATHTLTNTSNNVTTLAANTGSVAFYDSTVLAIGTVGATNGIAATAGTVLAETGTGDITISQNLSASSTGTSAIVVNAGKTAAAGTSTGGNVVLSGTPTFTAGTGGRVTLMTGAVNNAALTAGVGSGTGRFRYNSDETIANYSSVLGSGTYAIYREQPLLSVTPNTATSLYGGTPSLAGLTGTFANAVNGDSITNTGTASFTTTASSTSNVGSYDIAYSSGLSNGLGYGFVDATGSTGEYTVTQAPLTVTANSQNRLYGEANPTFTTSVSGFVNGESVSTAAGYVGSGSATTAATTTTNVGSATITAGAGTLAATNYDFSSLVNGTLSIGQRPITVTADAKTKVYGAVDPALTYTINTGTLVGSDSLGALTRTAGENVGSYTINAGALANGNYLITANNGALTIDQRPITVTADAKTKVYGNVDPALTFAVSTGSLVGSDTLTGVLTRTAGENVGIYTINASALANGNYLITANNGALTIDQRPITVTADAKTKVYGNVDPALTYAVTTGSLVGSDTLTGVLTRTAGENVGNYTINANALANGNYLITANNGALTIDQRPITVTADAKTKTAGEPDPALTYVTELASGNRGLISGDSLTGSLSRVSGETVGPFAIQQGTLTDANNTNYQIAYVTADLSIAAAPTQTPTPASSVPEVVAVVQATVAGAIPSNVVSGTVPTTPGGTVPSGGLAFVDVPSAPDTASNSSGGSSNTGGAVPQSGGRDASGFMRVFVVAGGIKLPPSAANITNDDLNTKAQ